jgi:1-deoxy-D-xylulose-5-phosphate synthase
MAYLDDLHTPRDLDHLDPQQLDALAKEIRERIISVVSQRGGHLASNLGITELTIALHKVFRFDSDRLLWDVGHQCYPHKLLTGRGQAFDRLRQRDGLSGFPAPSESPYDQFATGHAGTAISTALGLAWADQLSQRPSRVVAVVGDASIVNGLSMEAINNTSLLNRQLLIILNDNSMAIDRTHGSLARVLDGIRTSHGYNDLKHSAESFLAHMPLGGQVTEALRNLKEGLQTSLDGQKVFRALGLACFGPVDGHNIHEMTDVLDRLARFDRPALLHVITEKGRGCQYAVEDPCRFHSPSAYSIQGGKAVFETKARPTWTQVFGRALVDRAGADPRIVGITAAMPDGTGLTTLRDQLPQRYIDVGISESHAVGMAAGLAKAGLRPVVAIYSTFLQRAFDQAFHEVALQKLPVTLCMDRAGLVGSDGAVHHGFLDIAYLRPLPGMVLMAPADSAELEAAMDLALSLDGPAAIRYPRDEVPEDLPGQCPPFVTGQARVIRENGDAVCLCYGATVEAALAAGRTLQRERDVELGVVNARFAKPLDEELIHRLIASGKPVVTVEDHAAIGGFGSAVLELAARRGLDASNVRVLGLPDRFIPQASRQEQLADAGLGPSAIANTVAEMLDAAAERDTYHPHRTA